MKTTTTKMPSPSKRTVTDKLVDQAIRRFAQRLEKLYEECCPTHPATDDWFAMLDRVELKLMEMLAKRPLSRAEITAVVERAYKAIRQSLRAEVKKQPRMQECVHIETGETRLIPWVE